MSLLVSCLALEVVARHYVSGPLDCVVPAADPELLYALAPGEYESDGWLLRMDEVLITVQSDGCRRVPREVSERAGDVVLFVGDSMTFGLGVGDDDALPARVERMMNEGGGGPARVANCGVPGYNLTQAVRAAEIAASRVRPSTIVLTVHPSDLEEPADLSGLRPQTELARWLVQSSRLARVLSLVAAMASAERPGELPPQEVEAALGRLARLGLAHGARLIVLELGSTQHSQLSFREALDARGIEHHTIARPPRTSEYYLADDQHWTPLGTQRVASQVARLLRGPASPPR